MSMKRNLSENISILEARDTDVYSVLLDRIYQYCVSSEMLMNGNNHSVASVIRKLTKVRPRTKVTIDGSLMDLGLAGYFPNYAGFSIDAIAEPDSGMDADILVVKIRLQLPDSPPVITRFVARSDMEMINHEEYYKF